MIQLPRIADFENMEMYDSSTYYKDIFESVRLDIEDYRDEKYLPMQIPSGRAKPLFDISDDDFSDYKSLLDTNKNTVKSAIRIIITALMKKNKLTTFEPMRYPMGDKHGRRFFNIVYQSPTNQKIGIRFYWNGRDIPPLNELFCSIDEDSIQNEVTKIFLVLLESDYKKENKKVDKYYYYLDKSNSTEIDRLNKKADEYSKENIRFLSLERFFINCFGQKEYDLFIEAVDSFNYQARSMLGYKTLFMPNEVEVNHMRIARIGELRKFDYENALYDSIDYLKKRINCKDYPVLDREKVEFYRTCFDNFINNLRFIILAGDTDFADSFISSEWYYSTSFSTDILDKTAIVVGYLKSSEQLLYRLIRTHIGDKSFKIQHRKLKEKEKKVLEKEYTKIPPWLPFIEKYELYFDKTFGSLITFVEKYINRGLFQEKIDNHWKKFIVTFLYNYCREDRNDHLHKGNVYFTSEVNDIRNDTLLLYFLLLGSFEISDSGYRELGLDTAFERTGVFMLEDFVVRFSEWASALLDSCQSLDSTICFDPIYVSGEGAEILRFAEVDSFNVNDYEYERSRLSYKEDNLSYDFGKEMTDKEKGRILSKIIREYITNRKREKEDRHKYILIIYGLGYEIL